ncbi:MAG: hypothetical protein HY078_11730 [Elusimicrobia bacterium]|nr:hypothetical protein [Elusimicrobiota bacterium]
MADKINYVKEAFKRQENLITLAGLGVAGVAFNAGFLLLGGALELAYLWLISSNPRFQRVVNSEKSQARLRFDQSEKDKLAAALPMNEHRRFQELQGVRQRVYEAWQARDAVTQSLLQPSVDKLDYLLDTFLRAQVTLHHMRSHLASSDRAFLQKQAQMIEAEIARGLTDKVREVKERNLDILKQRLAKLQKLQEDQEIVKTQLDTLENAIKFVSDQSVSLTDPQQITGQIDRAVSEVGDTERSLQEVESFLGMQEGVDKKQEGAARQQAQQKQE